MENHKKKNTTNPIFTRPDTPQAAARGVAAPLSPPAADPSTNLTATTTPEAPSCTSWRPKTFKGPSGGEARPGRAPQRAGGLEGGDEHLALLDALRLLLLHLLGS